MDNYYTHCEATHSALNDFGAAKKDCSSIRGYSMRRAIAFEHTAFELSELFFSIYPDGKAYQLDLTSRHEPYSYDGLEGGNSYLKISEEWARFYDAINYELKKQDITFEHIQCNGQHKEGSTHKHVALFTSKEIDINFLENLWKEICDDEDTQCCIRNVEDVEYLYDGINYQGLEASILYLGRGNLLYDSSECIRRYDFSRGFKALKNSIQNIIIEDDKSLKPGQATNVKSLLDKPFQPIKSDFNDYVLSEEDFDDLLMKLIKINSKKEESPPLIIKNYDEFWIEKDEIKEDMGEKYKDDEYYRALGRKADISEEELIELCKWEAEQEME